MFSSAGKVKNPQHRRKKNHGTPNGRPLPDLNDCNYIKKEEGRSSSPVLNIDEGKAKLNSSSSLNVKGTNNIFQSMEFGSQFYTSLNCNEADGENYEVDSQSQLNLTTLSNDSNYAFDQKSYGDPPHGNLASNNDYSSLYTSFFNDNKKRPRQSSISQRLRQTSDLESRGIINSYQKGLLKDLIMVGDQQVVIALDSYIMTGDLNRFNSVLFSDGLSTGNVDGMAIAENKEGNEEKIVDNEALTTVLENKVQMQLQGQGLDFMDFDLNPLQLGNTLVNDLDILDQGHSHQENQMNMIEKSNTKQNMTKKNSIDDKNYTNIDSNKSQTTADTRQKDNHALRRARDFHQRTKESSTSSTAANIDIERSKSISKTIGNQACSGTTTTTSTGVTTTSTNSSSSSMFTSSLLSLDMGSIPSILLKNSTISEEESAGVEGNSLGAAQLDSLKSLTPFPISVNEVERMLKQEKKEQFKSSENFHDKMKKKKQGKESQQEKSEGEDATDEEQLGFFSTSQDDLFSSSEEFTKYTDKTIITPMTTTTKTIMTATTNSNDNIKNKSNKNKNKSTAINATTDNDSSIMKNDDNTGERRSESLSLISSRSTISTTSQSQTSIIRNIETLEGNYHEQKIETESLIKDEGDGGYNHLFDDYMTSMGDNSMLQDIIGHNGVNLNMSSSFMTNSYQFESCGPSIEGQEYQLPTSLVESNQTGHPTTTMITSGDSMKNQKINESIFNNSSLVDQINSFSSNIHPSQSTFDDFSSSLQYLSQITNTAKRNNNESKSKKIDNHSTQKKNKSNIKFTDNKFADLFRNFNQTANQQSETCNDIVKNKTENVVTPAKAKAFSEKDTDAYNIADSVFPVSIPEKEKLSFPFTQFGLPVNLNTPICNSESFNTINGDKKDEGGEGGKKNRKLKGKEKNKNNPGKGKVNMINTTFPVSGTMSPFPGIQLNNASSTKPENLINNKVGKGKDVKVSQVSPLLTHQNNSIQNFMELPTMNLGGDMMSSNFTEYGNGFNQFSFGEDGILKPKRKRKTKQEMRDLVEQLQENLIQQFVDVGVERKIAVSLCPPNLSVKQYQAFFKLQNRHRLQVELIEDGKLDIDTDIPIPIHLITILPASLITLAHLTIHKVPTGKDADVAEMDEDGGIFKFQWDEDGEQGKYTEADSRKREKDRLYRQILKANEGDSFEEEKEELPNKSEEEKNHERTISSLSSVSYTMEDSSQKDMNITNFPYAPPSLQYNKGDSSIIANVLAGIHVDTEGIKQKQEENAEDEEDLKVFLPSKLLTTSLIPSLDTLYISISDEDKKRILKRYIHNQEKQLAKIARDDPELASELFQQEKVIKKYKAKKNYYQEKKEKERKEKEMRDLALGTKLLTSHALTTHGAHLSNNLLVAPPFLTTASSSPSSSTIGNLSNSNFPPKNNTSKKEIAAKKGKNNNSSRLNESDTKYTESKKSNNINHKNKNNQKSGGSKGKSTKSIQSGSFMEELQLGITPDFAEIFNKVRKSSPSSDGLPFQYNNSITSGNMKAENTTISTSTPKKKTKITKK